MTETLLANRYKIIDKLAENEGEEFDRFTTKRRKR